MRNKRTKTVLDGFIGIVNESKRTPNKLYPDQEREVYYNNLMPKWLDYNDILMYFTYNEGMSVVAESFIITL